MKIKTLFQRTKFSEAIAGITFVAPFYLLFAVFSVFPIFYSLFVSFYRWKGFGPMRVIGTANYQMLIQDPLFFTTVYNTVIIWIGNVFLVVGLGFLMALILNSRNLLLRNFFSGLF